MSFDGLEPIVELLRKLAPRRRPPETLPITTIVTDGNAGPELLDEVSHWLASSGVPHAQVALPHESGPPPEPDEGLREIDQAGVDQVLDLLRSVAAQVETIRGGRYQLPRFRDVEWLMSLSLTRSLAGSDRPASPRERRNTLRTQLRNRAIGQVDNPQHVPTEVPWWLAIPLILGPNWWLRLRHSGQYPLVSGRYRWFRRQPFLSPGMNGDFLALADRLTLDRRCDEVQEQLLLFLVHAFLEDLRTAHRGWLAPRHRRTNAVVLVSGITRTNGGYPLLQAVNSVRNETGLLDPLLLVTSSRRVPPYAKELDEQPQVGDTATASRLELWQTELPQRWRKRWSTAWYLPVDMRTPHDTSSTRTRGPGSDRSGGQLPPPMVVPRVPLHRQRRTVAVVAVALVAAAVLPYYRYGHNHSERTCGDGFTWLGFEPRAATAKRVGEDCVGITDGTNHLLIPDSPLFRDATAQIIAANAEVDRRAAQADRPVITLVFLAALVPADRDDPNPLPAEAEQLAGLALAQKQQLSKGQASDPLVKVLIANAGRGSSEGEWVADQLGIMATADPSIVAAVGLNESRANTDRMIKRLATVGLPVVAATLSADSLADENHLYFQVSPQNRRQAKVAAAFAAHHLETNGNQTLTKKLHIYHSSDESDIYSQNLAQDLRESFTEQGFTVTTATFRPTSPRAADGTTSPPTAEFTESKDAGRDACNHQDAVVFYVGRPKPDFQGFLGGIYDHCRDQEPFLLAGDDVTRYVADESLRTSYSEVEFRYVSFAVGPEDNKKVSDFDDQLDKQFPGRDISSLDGHAALTYDAARTVITAASELSRPGTRIKVTGTSLWAILPSVTYQGVTGEIDFGGRSDQRVPLNKPVSILRVLDGMPDQSEKAYCAGSDNRRTKSWCPPDERVPE